MMTGTQVAAQAWELKGRRRCSWHHRYCIDEFCSRTTFWHGLGKQGASCGDTAVSLLRHWVIPRWRHSGWCGRSGFDFAQMIPTTGVSHDRRTTLKVLVQHLRTPCIWLGSLVAPFYLSPDPIIGQERSSQADDDRLGEPT